MEAARRGSVEMVELLFDQGASPDAAEGGHGQTAWKTGNEPGTPR